LGEGWGRIRRMHCKAVRIKLVLEGAKGLKKIINRFKIEKK